MKSLYQIAAAFSVAFSTCAISLDSLQGLKASTKNTKQAKHNREDYLHSGFSLPSPSPLQSWHAACTSQTTEGAMESCPEQPESQTAAINSHRVLNPCGDPEVYTLPHADMAALPSLKLLPILIMEVPVWPLCSFLLIAEVG